MLKPPAECRTGSISNSELMCLLCDDANSYDCPVRSDVSSIKDFFFFLLIAVNNFLCFFHVGLQFNKFIYIHTRLFKSMTSIPVRSREYFCSH